MGHLGSFGVIFGPLWAIWVILEKFEENSKKIAEKVRESGRHFWAIWGNFGPLWVILGPLWTILGHFWPFLDKFAESSNFFAGSLGSRDSLLECILSKLMEIL